MILDKLSNLQQRLIVSGFSVTIFATVLYLSHNVFFRPVFALCIAGIIVIALSEFYKIAQVKGFVPQMRGGAIASLAYVLTLYASTQCSCMNTLPVIVLGLSAVGIFLYYFVRGSSPLVNLSITLFGIIYITVPIALMLNINYYFPEESIQDGRWWLFYLLCVTKLTDTGAFFFGKRFGKTPMAPVISPKKTWEGALGGLVSAMVTSVMIYLIGITSFTPAIFELTFWQSVWLGGLISVAAQFGDLAESLLKRDGGIKDSSTQLPGLGGFLDIVDSLIFTLPLLYIFLRSVYDYHY